MASVGYATLDIIPSLKGMQGQLEKGLSGPIDKAGRDHGSKYGKVFASASMKPLRAVGAAAVGLFAVDKVKDFFASSIAEAREAQKVSAITAQVIKTTGGAAGVSAKQVSALAGAISNKTGIDDEAIQSGANLLLTFKNIRNEAGKGNNIFDQTTQIMTDMSAALGTDASGSAIQLGKALNDPVKGITALTRVGVSFTQKQKDTIAALVKTGDTMGAQRIILKELRSEFGGAAAASTTAGEKMQVAWGNLKEQIGTALLPTIDRVEKKLTGVVIPAVSKFLHQMQNGTGRGGEFARKFKSGFAEVKGDIESAYGVARKFIGAFNSLPGGVKKALALGAGAAYLGSKIPTGKGSLAGAAVKAVTGGVQKVFVVNPGFGGPGVGGAAGRGAGRLGAVGVGVVAAGTIAAGVGAAQNANALSNSIGAARSSVKDIQSISKALASSNVGKYADDLHINISRLATDIARYGDKGAYTAEVQKKLAATSHGFGGRAHQLADFLSPLIGKTEKAGVASLDLGTITRKAAKSLGSAGNGARTLSSAMAPMSRQFTAAAARSLAFNAALRKSGISAAQYQRRLRALPKEVRTKVSAPGALTSRDQVEKLTHRYNLTPKQKRTLMAIVGANKAAADAKNVQAKIRAIQDHKTPRVNVAVSGLGPLAQARALIAGLHDKHVNTTLVTTHITREIGGGVGHATGGWIHGPGTGTSDSIHARLSNGEFVVNARAAAKYRAQLEAINSQRFAAGGSVGGGQVAAGGGMTRIVLDAGGGVTLTGHIDNRITGRAALAATLARQGGNR